MSLGGGQKVASNKVTKYFINHRDIPKDETKFAHAQALLLMAAFSGRSNSRIEQQKL